MSQAKLGFPLSVPVVSVRALSHACLTVVTEEEARGTTHKKQSSSLFGPVAIDMCITQRNFVCEKKKKMLRDDKEGDICLHSWGNQ